MTAYEDWFCDMCGDMIDSASRGCENPHCGETPGEKRIRELEEEDEDHFETCLGRVCPLGDVE